MEWSNEVIGWIIAAFIPVIAGVFWPVLSIPWLIYMGWFIYNQFVAPKYLNFDDKVVYVTGCDSGFGQAVALDLDLCGCWVFAGCLHPEGDGAQSLRAQASDRLQILDLDVTDDGKVGRCADEIERFCQQNNLPGLWAVYNNAGITAAGEIEWYSMEDYQNVMNVNLWGPMRVTKSVLRLIRNAKGRVVTVTSGISHAVNPGRSGYCISKAALETFMDSLRYEMHKFGVKCCTINPGNLTGLTGIFENLDRSMDSVIGKVNPRLRAEYGDQYLQAVKDSVCSKYRGQGSSVTVETLVSAVRDALFLINPRVRYKPAQFSWILWWFVYYLLPDDLTDLVVAHWQKNMPKPACCR